MARWMINYIVKLTVFFGHILWNHTGNVGLAMELVIAFDFVKENTNVEIVFKIISNYKNKKPGGEWGVARTRAAEGDS